MATKQATQSTTELTFASSHIPLLEAGDYSIDIQQTISGPGIPAGTKSAMPTRTITVAGERFALKPGDIHAVFPPDGNLGEYSSVLPHLILNRSTLPWERQANKESLTLAEKKAGKQMPWLALLLFTEDELKTISQGRFGKELKLLTKTPNLNTDAIWTDLLAKKWLTKRGTSASLADVAAPDSRQKLLPASAKYENEILTLLGQVAHPHVMTLGALKAGSANGDVQWPKFTLETGEHDDEKVSVIDVRQGVLEKSMPARQELAYLTHVRTVDEEKSIEKSHFGKELKKLTKKSTLDFEPIWQMLLTKKWLQPIKGKPSMAGITAAAVRQPLVAPALAYVSEIEKVLGTIESGELAVAISNRLPQAGKTSVMHLVSVEHLYDKDESKLAWKKNAGGEHLIRLISLKSWRFSCVNPKHTFTELLKGLNTGPLIQPYPKSPSQPTPNAKAKSYIEMGSLPAEHTLRNGGSTVSWYRGPFSPNDYSKTFEDAHPLSSTLFPSWTADALLRYDPDIGMFDVSYAAAWELGRLMALNSKHFSVGLYQWKRAHSQSLRKLEQQELHPHLPPKSGTPGLVPLPKVLEGWFGGTSLLQHVPFNYLVPSSEMLPNESIRFFTLDPLWIASLIDGAFSIGRVTATDYADDQKRKAHITTIPQKAVSGFLLRSSVVAGWPALQVDGLNTGKKKLPLLRMERLSPNVLLCLFEGDAAEFDIHQKQETIHFGFGGQSPTYTKTLRNADGIEYEHKQKPKNGATRLPQIKAVPLKLDAENKNSVVDVTKLYGQIRTEIQNFPDKLGFKESYSVAQFALEMIEGVPQVRFLAKPKG